jgi:7-cyano-7-deazaguanine synthase in queuosine biosynthesis
MLVLWSGGCDSTLLLYDLCRQQQAIEWSHQYAKGPELKDSEKVRAISVFHDQIDDDKAKLEARARTKIFEEFKKRGLSFECLSVNVQNLQGETRGGCLESAIWVLSAVPYLKQDEDFYLGYVAEDDIWHNRDSYIRAFNGIQELMGNTGSVKFPLEWEYKLDIIKRLEKEKLLDLTWWCEHPKDKKPCGTCKSCYRMETTLFLKKLKEERAEKSIIKGLKKLKSRNR